MTIVSIVPEIALDEGYNYAGGLGVLEGDKFYAMARANVDYVVITLLYRNGYVSYSFDSVNNPIPQPQRQPRDFLSKLVLRTRLRVFMRGEAVYVNALEYTVNRARVVFLEPWSPRWAYNLTDRVYIEQTLEDKFYKYLLLAKGAAEYIRRVIGLNNVERIDLNEAYTALLPLVLPLPPSKYRFIIHTPGPWGHPSFPAQLFEREFGYRFFEDPVILTELGLSMSSEVIVVSEKMRDVISRVIPHHMHKVRAITNGVDSVRWVDERVMKMYREGNLNVDNVRYVKESMVPELEKLLRAYKPGLSIGNRPIIAWVRRVTRYKRPDFALRFINEYGSDDVVFVLGGKAHPYDEWGLRMVKAFKEASMKLNNVVYIHDYDVSIAKQVLSKSTILLFTPFPGWEASGTSFMKASMNGTVTLASRDGAVPELIIDGYNGWLFGIDERSLIDIGSDPRAQEINEYEYGEFSRKLKDIIKMYYNDKGKFYEVAVNAIKTFIDKADITVTLSKYYTNIRFKKP